MWQTVEYLTSKFEKPLVRSDSNTYDSLSFLEDEPPGKVIIHKLHCEIFLVEQDKIEMQLFSADATILKKKIAHENIKKQPSKVAHNRPQFFFQYCQLLKSSPNLDFCSIKIAHCWTFV